MVGIVAEIQHRRWRENSYVFQVGTKKIAVNVRFFQDRLQRRNRYGSGGMEFSCFLPLINVCTDMLAMSSQQSRSQI